ncbi:MAG: hypothetical protein KKE20_03650, partial [Nanoarchaeota archaeon]|nr:hypothetical protein [Nanoarchaeota archaeon]
MAEMIKKIDRRYTCLVCRRLMFRLAEKLAKQEKADFIVTGENLGQVASQTLDNLAVNDQATKMMILRPVLCYDKQDIVNMAKEIETYEISIEPPGCCRLVPSNPATKSTLEIIKREEEKAGVMDIVEDIEIERVI